MPTITIRVSATEKADIEAFANRAGQTVSDYIRESLEVSRGDDIQGLNTRVELLWSKVARLEELAGLS